MTADSPLSLSIAVAKELYRGHMRERRRMPLLTCSFEATIAGQTVLTAGDIAMVTGDDD
jgi:hypothetical protein